MMSNRVRLSASSRSENGLIRRFYIFLTILPFTITFALRKTRPIRDMKDEIGLITIRGEFLLAALLVFIAFAVLRNSAPRSAQSSTLTIFTEGGEPITMSVPASRHSGAAYE